MKLVLFAALLLVLSKPALGKIRLDKTIASFAPMYQDAREQIAKHGPENVLIVLDLDNTTLHSTQLLGSYAWYKWQEKMISDPTVSQVGKVTSDMGELYYLNGLLFAHGSMELAEKTLKDFLREMKAKGVTVLCLSARAPIYWADTIRDLQRNNLSFRAKIWDIAELSQARPAYDANDLKTKFGFTGEEISAYKLEHNYDIMLREGVFFASGLHKGSVLKMLLTLTQLKPKAIVFADDSRGNAKAMRESFTEGEIELSNFRYSRYDYEVEKFSEHSAAKAAQLWKTFQNTGRL